MPETLTSTKPKSWARLWATARPYARPMPRAGAWYPVVGEASGERVVIDVRGKKVAVAKRFLEVRPERPRSFTVVWHSRESVARLQETVGPDVPRIYGVCPSCAQRVRIFEGQSEGRCAGCGHRGIVAWDETG